MVHQMTALKDGIDFRHFDQSFAVPNQLTSTEKKLVSR